MHIIHASRNFMPYPCYLLNVLEGVLDMKHVLYMRHEEHLTNARVCY